MQTCVICDKQYIKERKKGYKGDICLSCSSTRRRRLIKQKAVDYKGGKCERCGYNKSNAGLTFHHLNPEEKEFGIAADGKHRKWEIVKKEVDKCSLLCLNCHAELHDEESTRKKMDEYFSREKSFEHGSKTAYSYHKCRCEICKESHNKRMKEYKKRKLTVP